MIEQITDADGHVIEPGDLGVERFHAPGEGLPPSPLPDVALGTLDRGLPES